MLECTTCAPLSVRTLHSPSAVLAATAAFGFHRSGTKKLALNYKTCAYFLGNFSRSSGTAFHPIFSTFAGRASDDTAAVLSTALADDVADDGAHPGYLGGARGIY